MKKTILFLLCSTISLLLNDTVIGASANDSANQTGVAVKSSPLFKKARISVGTRSLYIDLLEDTKGRPHDHSFIGSIYKIEADQDYAPLNPYVQVDAPVGPMDIGIGVGYDEFDVATVDNGSGDGDIELRNWMIYLIGAWPNQSRFKPFGEIGLFASQNDFDPLSSWSRGGRNEFTLENENSIYFAGGCDINIYENWSLNVYARYTDFDIQGEYIFRGDDRPPTPFYFTLEHVAYGLGAQYRF